jgi:glycosyltransferase involved in cell wall biosynthesis
MLNRARHELRRAIGAPLVPLRRITAEIAALVPTLRNARNLAIEQPPRDPKRLRVGIDILPFYEPLTGVGWYLFHLLNELANRNDLELVAFGDPLLTDAGPHLHVPLPPNVRHVVTDLRGHSVSRFSRRIASLALPLAAKLQRCDLFFGANYFLPRRLSPIANRRVVTVHDLTFRRFPDLLQKETLGSLNARMHEEIEKAAAIICVSEATRRDLLEFYRVDPKRAVTVLSGVASDRVEAMPVAGLPSRYLLFVSTIEPRKDVLTLLDAFEQLKDNGEYEGQLVLVGKVGWKSEDVVERLRTSRWRNEIVHLDYLKREQLAYVYAHAEMFVFPSIYEGFGFPLLEAMSHGVPCIASDSSSLPEVGGDAALYFEPRDAHALQARVRELLASPELRRHLIARGYERVDLFRWSDAAAQTAEVFRKVARP